MKKRVIFIVEIVSFILTILFVVAQVMALCGAFPNRSGSILGLITGIMLLIGIILRYDRDREKNY